MNRANWKVGQWNAYVVMGADKEERRGRLAECPVKYRDRVENHVRTYFAIKNRRA